MPKKLLTDFAAAQGLVISARQADDLLAYGQLVLHKKELLNLTAAVSLSEIAVRHLCDGIVAAAQIAALRTVRPNASEAADAGAGAGFIGITLAILLPDMRVTLLESLERRCAFMNWAVMQLGLHNCTVKNVRLGQGTHFAFDFLTERAMGQLPDILGICTQALKDGGFFLAFQGKEPQLPAAWGAGIVLQNLLEYTLPEDTPQKRHLAVIEKGEYAHIG